MINNVTLVGRLVRDPELRRTGNGTAVVNFTLAVNRPYAKEGDVEADFINILCWDKTAENVEKYCFKGSLVGITGEIQTRSYDNKEGNRVYVTEVVARSVQFISTPRSEEPEPTPSPAPTKKQYRR